MSENRKLHLSRRDFMRFAALATGGAALAGGLNLPELTRAQGTVEITVADAGRDTDVHYDQLVVDVFNAKMKAAGKPYVAKLVVGPATDNDYITKLNLDLASGTASDVMNIGSHIYQDLIAADYLADLTDLVNAWPEWSKFAPVIKDQVTVDGKVYSLSWATTFTMFYRKDLLEKAGIPTTQPTSWDDFYGIADKIATKIPGMTPAGFPAARPWGGGTWDEGFKHVWLGFAKPSEIWDPADKKWVVSSNGLLKALQVYENLAKNKWLTVEALLSPNPWEPIKYQGFVQGKVGVVTGGDWQWQFDWGPKGQAPIDDIYNKVERWLFPSAIGKPFPYSDFGQLLVINKAAKDIPGAFSYITEALSPEGSCKALEYLFSSPSALSDYGDSCPYYATGVNGKMAEAAATLATGLYLKTGPGESKIVDGLGLATENVISMTQTSEQAMEAFAAAMKDAIGADGVKTL